MRSIEKRFLIHIIKSDMENTVSYRNRDFAGRPPGSWWMLVIIVVFKLGIRLPDSRRLQIYCTTFTYASISNSAIHCWKVNWISLSENVWEYAKFFFRLENWTCKNMTWAAYMSSSWRACHFLFITWNGNCKLVNYYICHSLVVCSIYMRNNLIDNMYISASCDVLTQKSDFDA